MPASGAGWGDQTLAACTSAGHGHRSRVVDVLFGREPMMSIEVWLQAALADAERRGLPELKPLLEAIARAARTLRDADFVDDLRRSS